MRALKQINLESTGLIDSEGGLLFDTNLPRVPLLRITGEIMIYSDKEKIFMGDFVAKNLLSDIEYSSYWLKVPDELYPDIDYIRVKNFDRITTNSNIGFIILANNTDPKTMTTKFTYSIDLLNNLDR